MWIEWWHKTLDKTGQDFKKRMKTDCSGDSGTWSFCRAPDTRSRNRRHNFDASRCTTSNVVGAGMWRWNLGLWRRFLELVPGACASQELKRRQLLLLLLLRLMMMMMWRCFHTGGRGADDGCGRHDRTRTALAAEAQPGRVSAHVPARSGVQQRDTWHPVRPRAAGTVGARSHHPGAPAQRQLHRYHRARHLRPAHRPALAVSPRCDGA